MDSHILNSTSSKELESRNASEYAKRESWPCVVNVQHNRKCVFCHFAKIRENASMCARNFDTKTILTHGWP